jgi:hypothetical protein
MPESIVDQPIKTINKYPVDTLTNVDDTFTPLPTQNTSEMEILMTRHFIGILADVAIAVVARKLIEEEHHEEVVR